MNMERFFSGKIVSVLIALVLLAILIISPTYAEGETTGTTVTTPGYDPSIDAVPDKEGVAAFSIDGFLRNFRAISVTMEQEFLLRAQKLFWLLAGIQFAYATISLGRRGEFSFNSIIELLIREIMYISFFWMLVSWPNIGALSGGNGIGSTIVDGLRRMGADITSYEAITPSTVLGSGTELAWMVVEKSFELNILRGMAAIFPAIIIVIAFSLAAAHTAVMLIEYYIVAPVGILMLGLGGSLWTKNYAETYLRCLFTIGIKLLCLQVVLAICIKYISKLITISENGIAGSDMGHLQACFFLAGLSIIIFMAIQQVPSFASGLLSGSSSGSASALTGAMGAIGGAAMAVAGLAGAGKDAYDAHKDASGDSGGGLAEASEISDSGGSDGGSGGDGGTSSSTPELPSALREDSSSAPSGDSGSAASSGDGGDSSAPGGDDGDSSAPSGDGGDSSAPSGDGGDSSAPGGDGGDSSAPSGDGGSSAPSGGDSATPSSDGGSAAAPVGGDSSAPSDDGGSATSSSSGGSSTSSTKSQQGTTPKTIPSVSSSSRSAFVAKAMIRHALGMKPISHSMKTQLNKMQALRDMGMTDKQNTMNQAMFPGTLG